MLFSSTIFLFLFLPLILLIYYNPIVKRRNYRNIVLLLASLLFYAWGEPIFVFLLLISILITWAVGCIMDKYPSKILLTITIVYHVGVLVVFKYLTFVTTQMNAITQKNLFHVEIEMPIGISFFTFQLISYLFDVYYKKAYAQKNLLYVGLYVAFFPQLIAGPIVRYQDISYQIEDRKENKILFYEGISRFSIGLGKKLLLADYMAFLADMIFASNGTNSILTAWFGAIAYTLQIYFDFSGYSDMAIGLGRMFGFSFNENFNYPYISKNITEFWRRWHISLSTWFRDYVYIPLGGNRVSKRKWMRNMFLVWLLTGIWHGANWTFIVWGMIYFCCLFLEKTTNFTKNMGFASRIYTCVVVIVAWVIFRASSLTDAFVYIANMFNIFKYPFIDKIFLQHLAGGGMIMGIACVATTPILKESCDRLEKKGYTWLKPIICLVIFVLSIMCAISSTYSPFIYFNF